MEEFKKKCGKCGYEWLPRSNNPNPKRCPRCGSPKYWRPRVWAIPYQAKPEEQLERERNMREEFKQKFNSERKVIRLERPE